MIEKCASRLRSTYLTILEVGGAYAHRFVGLLAFLRIPYLIVTDLDSVEAAGHHPVCRADAAGAHTSNAALKMLFGKTTVAELIALPPANKIDELKSQCISFQMDVTVVENGSMCAMRPRTLEEALAYANFSLLRAGTISIGVPLPDALDDAYEEIYRRVASKSFKKTDFAMDLLACKADWTVPTYIAEGLKWLETRLCNIAAPPVAAGVQVPVGGGAA